MEPYSSSNRGEHTDMAPPIATPLLRLATISVLAILLGAGGALFVMRSAPAVTLSQRTKPGVAALTGAANPLHILFIGNSYTTVNDLPGTLGRLAASGGNAIATSVLGEGGWTLSEHETAQETATALHDVRWDLVVLQEQSQVPASSSDRTQTMYPAVRALARASQSIGATPLLFLTWGHRTGWPELGLQSYAAMQDQVTNGYTTIANQLGLPVAPVGEAWRQGTTTSPPLDLWQADDSHPTMQGTYLAACVFYATIFRRSPQGLAFQDGLNPAVARTIQNVAAQTVLGDLSRWNLRAALSAPQATATNDRVALP